MGAAAAVEKNALVLFALLSARRERRWTPREVSIVGDVDDDEVGVRPPSVPALSVLTSISHSASQPAPPASSELSAFNSGNHNILSQIIYAALQKEKIIV